MTTEPTTNQPALDEFWRLWASELFETRSMTLIVREVDKVKEAGDRPVWFIDQLIAALETNKLDEVWLVCADALGMVDKAQEIRDFLKKPAKPMDPELKAALFEDMPEYLLADQPSAQAAAPQLKPHATREQHHGFTCPSCGGHRFGTCSTNFKPHGANELLYPQFPQGVSVGHCNEYLEGFKRCGFTWNRNDPEQEKACLHFMTMEQWAATYAEQA